MSHKDTDMLSEQQAAEMHGPSLSGVNQLLDQESSESDASAAPDAEDVDTEARTFVRMLAADVSSGKFDLPSWPEVVVQIRQALEDEECSIDNIVRLIGSDAVLAARTFKIANSALISRGEPVNDLQSAVTRLGFDMVRSVAISLAMEQIFHGEAAKAVKPYLVELWLHSTKVAALAYLLAKRDPRINADEAFLVGLVHDIGKLYVLMRAQNDPVLFDCEESLQEIMDAWHTSIGRAIVESWGFSEELAQAVSDHELYDLEGSGPPTLTDVVAVANLLAKDENSEPSDRVDLNEVSTCRRLGLNTETCADIIQSSAVEIQAMLQALCI